jgi:PAS domain S-box-containing protein
MKSKNKPSYKELQERLINAEAALETLRSEQIDSNKENRKTLQPSPTQTEPHGSHLEQVIFGMHNISQLISHPIALISPDFRYLSVNHAYTKYFGADTDQIIGHTAASFLGDEVFNTQVKPRLQRCFQGETIRYQTKFNFPSLGYRWMDINYTPYYDELNVITGVVAQSFDITDLKQVQFALQESESKFRTLVNQAPQALFLHAMDSSILDVNQAAIDRYGYTRQELLSMKTGDIDLDFEVREDAGRFWQQLEEAQTITFEARHKRKNGSLFPVKIRLSAVEIQGQQCIFALAEDISEQKKAEQSLRDSEELFRTVFEHAAVGIAQVAPDGRFQQVNPKLCKITGYTKDEFRTLNFADITHPDDLYLEKTQIDRVLSGEIDSFEIEKRYLHKEGHPIWIKLFSSVVRDKYGNAKYAIASIADITQEKQALKKLEQSEQKFRDLAENTIDWIWQVDNEFNYTYSSPNVEKLIGFSASDVIGKSAFDFMPADESKRIKPILENMIANRERIFNLVDTLIHKNGRPIIFETNATPIFDEYGGFTGYFGTCRDITDRKRVEEDLRLYFYSLSQIKDRVVITDLEGTIQYINDAACRMLGKSRSELIGKNVSIFGEDDSTGITQANIIKKTLQDGFWRGEVTNYRADGSPVYLDSRIFLVKDDQGHSIALCGISTDITKNKRAEQALRDSEQLLRNVIDTDPSCIFVKDKQGKYLLVNQAIADLYKTEPENMLGKTDLDFVGAEVATQNELEDFISNDLQVIEKNQLKIIPEESMTYQDGSVHWFQTYKVPIHIEGKGACLLGVAIDITKRKKVEDALRENEAILNEAQEIANIGSYIWDIKSDHLEWSHHMYEIAGIDPDSFDGNLTETINKMIHPSDRDQVNEQITEMLAQKSTSEMKFRLVRPDGDVRWLRSLARFIFDDLGNPIYALGVHHDITDYQQAQDELKKHRDHLEELVRERTDKLNKMVNMMAGREVRMAELKEVIKKLRSQLSSAGIAPIANDPLLEALDDLE